jgi:uncharacterized protein YjbI with pentapeptide repeats
MKRSISLIAASLIVFGGLSGAQAFDEGHLHAVESGQKECPGCDLSDAYLKDLDLRMVNLAGANLKGAKLTNARFEQVDLSKVSLEGVNLEKTWCDWATKLPAGSGWTCDGIVLIRK